MALQTTTKYMARTLITFNDLGYGGSILKPMKGELDDEVFVQGDDYDTVKDEIAEIEQAWKEGKMRNLFPSVKNAISYHLSNYFD